MSMEQDVLFEMSEIDEETRWTAVETRDTSFNGIFVYGVHSTQIYCKPSCPSRRPLKKGNVKFFDSFQAAEDAGFRACRRCRPRESVDPQVEMIKRACRLIETQGAQSLAALSSKLEVSPYHLQRTFKSITGLSPRQYAAAHRTTRFKNGVKQGAEVIDAMYDAGYNSSSRLYEKADSELGMTPATYQRGGDGMLISYATVGCVLGRLLVAATARGLCAVRLGDSDEELEDTLFAEFSAAEIRRDEATLTPWIEAILRHLDGEHTSLDLPLDVRATAFQRRVWEELRRIPYGTTRSYGEIAHAIGQPRAVRAVARACAANPVALVTPCHRVIREDGSLGGYRWSMERKQSLLKQEQRKALEVRPDVKV